MSIQNDLVESVSEILEPNLQFYRKSPTDTVRYFVDPSVLATLGWIATSIALPILLCGVNEVVKEQVKQWLTKRKAAADPTLQPPDALLQELTQILESKGSPVIHKDELQEATNEVSKFLSHRGWPTPLALADAQGIIEIIRTRIGKS